jgi:energy-coupling factor transport system ATP-binding protein
MESGLMPGTTAARLEVIHPQLDIHAHPRDLSEGQRLALALAVVTAHQPQVLLLDEPTRGCDYLTKARLAALLREMVQHGVAVLLATHDVELAAGLADRVAVLSHGELIANDCVREVVRHSPTLAPQVAKILSPLDLLTMDEVTKALTERGTLQ